MGTQTQELQILQLASNYKNWILSEFKPHLGSKILEIGAGLGLYTQEFKQNGKVAVTEISDKHIRALKKRFKNEKNIKIIKADVSNNRSIGELSRYKFDTCIFINVLEHIKDDQGALINVNKVLVNNGKVLIFAPAFQFLFGSIDELVGHYRRYTKNDLKRKLKTAGFEVEKIYYFNIVGFFGWWFNNKARRIKENSLSHVLFFDRFVVPLFRRFEKIYYPPFGQSLVAIGRKKP